MKWSWKLGEIAGIGVFMHSTFLILIAWIGISYWRVEQSMSAVAEGVGFILALFGCVLLHELGHALAAQRYGIQTRDITLLPIGGLARLERMPEDPKQELVIAIAGPLVNVVIATALLVGLSIGGAVESLESIAATGGGFFTRLMYINVTLVVFNMLPAFPMDGGRVLRAVLATQMDYAKATQKAASVGQVMALVFGFLGLMWNPFLVFIALFVWIGAAQEAASVQLRAAINGVPVETVMQSNFESLTPNHTVGDAVNVTLKGSQQDFPVLDHETVVGVLTQAELLKALATRSTETRVTDVMDKTNVSAETSEMLESVLARLEKCDCHTVPVTRDGQLVGIVTLENLSEFLRIQEAMNIRAKSAA